MLIFPDNAEKDAQQGLGFCLQIDVRAVASPHVQSVEVSFPLTRHCEYHIEYFLNFMLKVLNESLADIDFYQKKIRAFSELSESATKVLACFRDQPETRLQTKDIVEVTELPRRTIANALIVLLRDGFIQKYGKGAGARYQIIF